MLVIVSFWLKKKILESGSGRRNADISSKGTLSKCSQENVHFVFLAMELLPLSRKVD